MPNVSLYLFMLEKILAIAGALVYIVFAIVIVRQVASMTKNVQDKFNGILIVFSYIHLLFSVGLFLLTLAI